MLPLIACRSLALGLRVYFSPLFLDPVSLLMAYHQVKSTSTSKS
jgi:hypothetical protein